MNMLSGARLYWSGVCSRWGWRWRKAAAATYLLPEGHPAPLMVQGPGSYETRDYLKFGAGLVAITVLVVAVLVPLMWPF